MIFLITNFQYIWGAVVFSLGWPCDPFRKSIIHNLAFSVCVVLGVAASLYMALAPSDVVTRFFHRIDFPDAMNHVPVEGSVIANATAARLNGVTDLAAANAIYRDAGVTFDKHDSPTRFQIELVGLAFLNFAAMLFAESAITIGPVASYFRSRARREAKVLDI